MKSSQHNRGSPQRTEDPHRRLQLRLPKSLEGAPAAEQSSASASSLFKDQGELGDEGAVGEDETSKSQKPYRRCAACMHGRKQPSLSGLPRDSRFLNDEEFLALTPFMLMATKYSALALKWLWLRCTAHIHLTFQVQALSRQEPFHPFLL